MICKNNVMLNEKVFLVNLYTIILLLHEKEHDSLHLTHI